MKYGFLVANSAEAVQLPPSKRGARRHKPFVRPEQFSMLVQLIEEPYATMVYVAVYTGLRVSEVIALRWSDIHEQSITIDERYCRGDWAAPKSDASNTTIPVNRKVIERIQCLRTLTVEVKAGRAIRRYRAVKSDGPDDHRFSSLSRVGVRCVTTISWRGISSRREGNWESAGSTGWCSGGLTPPG